MEQEARRRKRRLRLTCDGKLARAALDHPARGVTAICGNPLAMGDRFEYLRRARRVLGDPDLDGGLRTEQSLSGMGTIADLRKLPDILQLRGYSESDTRGVMDGNWLRFFQAASKDN